MDTFKAYHQLAPTFDAYPMEHARLCHAAGLAEEAGEARGKIHGEGDDR